MLMTPQIKDASDIAKMVHKMNHMHEYYSGFMSKDFSSITLEIQKNIELKTIVVAEDFQGVMSYFINEETKCIDIAGPYVNDFNVNLGVELIEYVMNHYPNYQLNFFFDRQSQFYTSIMDRLHASYQGNETILSLQKTDFKVIPHHLNISPIKEDDKKCIQEMHEKIFPNVYITASELIKEENNKHLYVLHDDDQPIGYGLIKLMKEQAFLEIFAIDEPYRGRGLAKPFITSIIQEAFKHQDIKKIFLVVDDINEIAYQLYQKIGFNIQNQNVSYHIHQHV